MPSDRAAAAGTLERARLEHLAEQGRAAGVLHPAIALVIVGAFYGSVATPLLMAWFAALATLLLVGLGTPHLLAKLRLEAQLSIAVLCALVMATGIVWGSPPGFSSIPP